MEYVHATPDRSTYRSTPWLEVRSSVRRVTLTVGLGSGGGAEVPRPGAVVERGAGSRAVGARAEAVG